MYCPTKLKLNRFKKVAIPSVRDMFRNSGLLNLPSTVYTGDEPAYEPGRKLDDLQQAHLQNVELLNEEDQNRE